MAHLGRKWGCLSARVAAGLGRVRQWRDSRGTTRFGQAQGREAEEGGEGRSGGAAEARARARRPSAPFAY
eukprot:scaffold17847_cov119-Isochrysis_galbana.AAC.3